MCKPKFGGKPCSASAAGLDGVASGPSKKDTISSRALYTKLSLNETVSQKRTGTVKINQEMLCSGQCSIERG